MIQLSLEQRDPILEAWIKIRCSLSSIVNKTFKAEITKAHEFRDSKKKKKKRKITSLLFYLSLEKWNITGHLMTTESPANFDPPPYLIHDPPNGHSKLTKINRFWFNVSRNRDIIRQNSRLLLYPETLFIVVRRLFSW